MARIVHNNSAKGKDRSLDGAGISNARELIIGMLQKQHPELRGTARVWKLNDSKLWYLSDKQVKAYLAVDSSESYKRGMHDAEQDLIDRNMNKILAQMAPEVSFLDLGCGNALMTIGIVKRAEMDNHKVTFYPVDINTKILELAVKNARKAGIAAVEGLNGDFEQLDALLERVDQKKQRFLNLGANFVNFDSNRILSIIASAMRLKDVVYFSAQLGDKNEDEIVRQYDGNPATKGMALGTLEHLGFSESDVEQHARMNKETSEIECYAVVKKLPAELNRVGIKIGDQIVVVTSFKPTLRMFKETALRYFDGDFLFNEAGTYIGFVGRRR